MNSINNSAFQRGLAFERYVYRLIKSEFPHLPITATGTSFSNDAHQYGDGGRDIEVLYKSTKFLIDCKDWSSRKMGVNDIGGIIRALMEERKKNPTAIGVILLKEWIFVSPQALDFGKNNGILFITLEDFLDVLRGKLLFEQHVPKVLTINLQEKTLRPKPVVLDIGLEPQPPAPSPYPTPRPATYPFSPPNEATWLKWAVGQQSIPLIISERIDVRKSVRFQSEVEFLAFHLRMRISKPHKTLNLENLARNLIEIRDESDSKGCDLQFVISKLASSFEGSSKTARGVVDLLIEKKILQKSHGNIQSKLPSNNWIEDQDRAIALMRPKTKRRKAFFCALVMLITPHAPEIAKGSKLKLKLPEFVEFMRAYTGVKETSSSTRKEALKLRGEIIDYMFEVDGDKANVGSVVTATAYPKAIAALTSKLGSYEMDRAGVKHTQLVVYGPVYCSRHVNLGNLGDI